MAKPDIITLKGKVGNLVFYTWKNKPVIRSHPGRIRQTKATKKSAGLFGKASAISKVLREELKDVLPDVKDMSMRLRLNAAIFQWLRGEGLIDKNKIQLINRFEFNGKFPLSSRLKKYPEVDCTKLGKLVIRFPELNPVQDIIAPFDTTKLFIKITLVGCRMNSVDAIESKKTERVVDYTDRIIPAKVMEVDTDVKGCLALVVLAIRYEVDGKIYDDLRWIPVGVVARGLSIVH